MIILRKITILCQETDILYSMSFFLFADIGHSGRSGTERDSARGSPEMGTTIDRPISRSPGDRLHRFLAGRFGFQCSSPSKSAGSRRLENRAFKPAARATRSGLLRRRARVRRYEASRSRR